MISISSDANRVFRPAVAAYPRGASFGPRTAEVFEFVWIISGAAVWTWHGNDTRVRLEPGELLLVRPGMRDHFEWSPDTQTRHGYAHFRVHPAPESSGWPLTRKTAARGPVGGLLDYLLWLAEEPTPSWVRHAEETVGTLLRLFVSAPLPEPATSTLHPALAAAHEYTRQEWAREMRPLALGELANAAGVSQEHLARLFRDRYGIGPVRALGLVRLDRAATLLAHSNLTVTEIAKACGYADPLHFSKRFAAVYGVSPRTYRQHGSPHSPLADAGLLPLAGRLTRIGR